MNQSLKLVWVVFLLGHAVAWAGQKLSARERLTRNLLANSILAPSQKPLAFSRIIKVFDQNGIGQESTPNQVLSALKNNADLRSAVLDASDDGTDLEFLDMLEDGEDDLFDCEQNPNESNECTED